MLAGTRAATAGSFGGVGMVTVTWWLLTGVAKAVPVPGINRATPLNATATTAIRDLRVLRDD